MSDETPAPKSRKAPKTEVVDTPVEATAPDSAPTETATEPAAQSSESAKTKDEAATATGEVAPAQPSMAGQQVVYVQAPLPPRVRGNRVVGVLLALLGTVVFAAVYAGAATIPISLGYGGGAFSPTFSAFLQSATFWIPIMMFALGFIVVTVILNRAGWWAHVIGSLLVAVFVYFSTIGLLMLVGNLTHDKVSSLFGTWVANPLMIAAALVAREVSIWIGLAIAARGRRVRVRNDETRTAWDREQEEKRAEYEGTGTAPAA
jgi:hypothetical protein